VSTIRRTFQREAGNDGATRFYEQPEQGAEPAIGQLDLSARAIRELGDPERIVVTIKRPGGGVAIDPPDNIIPIP
jgi:hypothetical protein